MSVSFPSPYFGSVGVRPLTGISQARSEGGLRITSRRGTPYWAGPMLTGQLELAEQTEWLSFLNRCVDLNLRVDWIHPFYPLPAAYTDGSWPLEDDPTISGVTDLRTFDVDGLQMGMVLTRGDRVTLMEDGAVCYREIAETVTVTSTSAQEISLSPRVPSGLFTTAASIRFEDPFVRLAIVADSWDPEQVNGPMGLRFDVEEAFR